MKRFSAQYIYTNTGPPLKRGVITTDDSGAITNLEDTGGGLHEKHSVEFHNGIIIPGFVNCHCHLELSHLKNSISPGSGLPSFIEKIRNTRAVNLENIISSAYSADNDMFAEGINLCADICNTANTFNIKKESRISYFNFLEVFGIDSQKAGRRLAEIVDLADKAREMNLPLSIVPHSVYSLSLPLFRLLRERTKDNKVTSIHFMETPGEASLVENHAGPLMESYLQSGLLTSGIETVASHSDAILNEITLKGNLILVHNTFTDRTTVRTLKERPDLYWCLCPNSNAYIEEKVPPLDLLIDEECMITIGTDSLASNIKLSILEELKTLQLNFPSVSIGQLITWSTLNGARALGMQDKFGTIEPGKSPGLLLIQNADLINMKLLPDSYVTRLV